MLIFLSMKGGYVVFGAMGKIVLVLQVCFLIFEKYISKIWKEITRELSILHYCDLKDEEIVGSSYEKELKISKSEKVINPMLNGKSTIVLLTVGLIKNTQFK